MKDFVFHNPTKIVFGRGKASVIGDELSLDGHKKVLMIYGGGSIKRNGTYQTVVESFKRNNIEHFEISGVKPNPILSKVKEAISFGREKAVTAVVPVGGGSVYDSAKAIAAGIATDNDIWEAFLGKWKVKSALPIYGILTISATGSEMNGNAVITDEKTSEKRSISASVIYPRVSIIDPEIQFTLPKNQTVNGAVDAISHVCEYFFNGYSESFIQDHIAASIIRTIISSTEVLIDEPQNYEARAQFAWAATLALNGINAAGRGSGDWASHQIEHSLSGLYDIPHGVGLSIIMPAWMQYVLDTEPSSMTPRFDLFAKLVFDSAEKNSMTNAHNAIQKLKNWFKNIGQPVSLTEVGLSEKHIPQILDNIERIGLPTGKAKKLYRDDVEKILKLAI
ncbi:MAG: iron-containing alcohol dehydrogenase [Thermotogaceae bacterium]|nr:iron-containing alcohol dehydrogenase [Thermotogaceae bacterium]